MIVINKVAVVWGAVALLTSFLAVSTVAAGEPKIQEGKLTCVKWKSEVRYSGLGYDHLVHLDNQCDHNAECMVKTDVNPKGVKQSLKPKEKATVLTMRGSAAREFKAEVSCTKK